MATQDELNQIAQQVATILGVDLADLNDSVQALLGRRDLTLQQQQDFVGGSTTGGPTGNGYYPMDDSTGFRRMVPSVPKAVEIITASSPGLIYPDMFDPLAGTGADHDDRPALQAMFDAQQTNQKLRCALRTGTTYYPYDTIRVDPSLNSLEGNEGILNFSRKVFIDPYAQPTLSTNPNFTDGGNGWFQSPNQNRSMTYAPNSAVFNTPETPAYSFMEWGQQITVAANTELRIEVEFNSITPTYDGTSVFRDCVLTIRKPAATVPAALAGGAPAASGGAKLTVAAKKGTPIGTPDTTIGKKTFGVITSVANPVIRIQSGARLDIKSVNVYIVPDNTCLYFRATPRGANGGAERRSWKHFRIVGRSSQNRLVDAVKFDSRANDPARSRVNFEFVQMTQSIGRGLIFAGQAYLHNFYSCHIVCAVNCITSIPNSVDAGENISFFGGNMGVADCAVYNPASFAFRMYGVSIDFCKQFYDGSSFVAVGCWFEYNGVERADLAAGQEPIDRPAFRVSGGSCLMSGCTFLNDAGTSPGFRVPFFVSEYGHLTLDNVIQIYNFQGTERAMAEGGGRVSMRLADGTIKAIGNRNIEAITMRDDDHNVLGSRGHFAGADGATPPTCVTVSGRTFQTRFRTVETTTNNFTGDVTPGSRLITNVTPAPVASTSNGRNISFPGFVDGTKVVSNQGGGTTFTGTTSTASNVITNVTPGPTASTAAGKYIYGPGLAGGARIIAYTSNSLTLDQPPTSSGVDQQFSTSGILVASQPFNDTAATAATIPLRRFGPEEGVARISTKIARTGTSSLEFRKDLFGNSNFFGYLLLPCQPGRSYGSEFWWAMPPNETASDTATTAVYFSAFLCRVNDPDGAAPGIGGQRQYLTDIPKTGIPTKLGTAGYADPAAPGVTDLWRRLSVGLHTPGLGEHDGFIPDWATHLVWQISMIALRPGSSVFIADLHGNNQ